MAFVQVPQFQMPQQGAPPVSVAPRSPLVQELLMQSMQPMGAPADYSGAIANPMAMLELQPFANRKNAPGSQPGTAQGGLLGEMYKALPGGMGFGANSVPGTGMFGSSFMGTPWASAAAPGPGQSEPM